MTAPPAMPAAPSVPAAPTVPAVPTLSIEDCGVAVPGWLLRLTVGVVAAGVVAVFAAEGAPISVLVVFGLVAMSCALSPSSAAAAALGGAAPLVSIVYNTADVLSPAVLVLVPLVHLLHVTSGIAAVVPRGARLHLPALRRPLRRFAIIQAGVFALAGLVAVAPAGRNPVPVEVLAVLGVAGLAVLATVQLRRR
jgi:hypothetical protein